MNPPAADQELSGSPAARLCTACGICCSGFFFSYVELQSGDEPSSLSALLPLRQREGKTVFTLRCPALQGRCCSIYEQRPQTCRGYRCDLLKTVESDLDALPPALGIVANAVATFDHLASELSRVGFGATEGATSEATKPFRRAYAEAIRTSDRAFFERHHHIILLWKKAAWLVHENFDRKVGLRLALRGPHPVRK